MNDFLLIMGGLFGELAYVFIIKKGFEDKTYGMPIAALLANISWEFIYSFVHGPNNIQFYVNVAWFSLDCIVFYQLLKYWRTEIKDISSRTFYIFIFVSLIMAYLLVIYIEKKFSDGGFYSAFGANFMMSYLFILMLYRRKSLRGQSIYIAISKLLCTVATCLAAYKYQAFMPNTGLLEFLYLSMFFLDSVYVVLVFIQMKKPFLLSWNRVT
jgi:hypothetical protein